MVRQDERSDLRVLGRYGGNSGAIPKVTGAPWRPLTPPQPCILHGWLQSRGPRAARCGGGGNAVVLIWHPVGIAPSSLPAPRPPNLPGRKAAAPAHVCACRCVKIPARTARRAVHRGRPWRAQGESFKNVNKLIKISRFTSSCFTARCPPLLSGVPRERKHRGIRGVFISSS